MQNYQHGDLRWFQDARFGMFIHWGLYAMPARHEWIRSREEIPDEKYQIYFDLFEPDLFQPQEWARQAREAGMKYVVITSKHHEGFCLFDSQYTDYKATNTPAKRDLLREIVDAFRAEGLRIGFYYSLLDWHHPDCIIDDRCGPYRNLPAEERARMNEGRSMARYQEYMRNQVTELLTNYGRIDILWFDFSYPCAEDPADATRGKGRLQWDSEKLLALVRQLQPEIILNNRLDLPGANDITTPEQYTPAEQPTDESGNPAAWEGCQTFSGSWGYFRDETSWKSADQCIKMLIDHVSRNGNLLMNVGPTARGTLDARARERLADYAEWMRVNARSIYGCGQAAGLTEPEGCRYTFNPATGRLYLHIYSWPFRYLVLPGLGGKVRYAQLLSDASEIICHEAGEASCGKCATAAGDLMLELPVHRPADIVPVVEIFLR